MNYLIVVAHPDDEVLGAGASMWKWANNHNNKVYVCIMSSKAEERQKKPSDSELQNDIVRASDVLNVKRIYNGSFKNLYFNNVPHVELVRFIEECIIDCQPDVIITHHPGDTNNDHLHTSLACQAAGKLFQRRPDIKPIKEFLFMEVLSSTDWCINGSLTKFNPNYFVQVGEEAVNKKIESLSQYVGVMRDYPHSRSAESIKALATYRGSQSNCLYAESFEMVFKREE